MAFQVAMATSAVVSYDWRRILFREY